MRLWGISVAAVGLAVAAIPFQPQAPSVEKPWTLVLSGQTEGYLSPCGCTYPMTGGIRRRATAVKQIAEKAHVVLIDTGNFTNKSDRQSELKAETMAQAVDSMGVAAVALTAQDARLGPGIVSSLPRLAEGKFVASDLSAGRVEGVSPYVEQGPFLIGSVSPDLGDVLRQRSISSEEAATKLVSNAKDTNKIPVLMLDGNLDEARDLARKVPGLGLIAYRRAGWPTENPEYTGNVLLASPGERGKAIVKVTVKDGKLGGYAVTRLGPELRNDPDVDRLFKYYLRRVGSEDLLSKVPRLPSDPFAGSAACAKCHVGADKVWRTSAHSHSLATLEHEGQVGDPDCVSCHVTGLTSDSGYISRLKTPSLAFVGCESCHGPAKAHALNPKRFHLPKVGSRACASCHTVEQSPRFQFLTYWRKIAHK